MRLVREVLNAEEMKLVEEERWKMRHCHEWTRQKKIAAALEEYRTRIRELLKSRFGGPTEP